MWLKERIKQLIYKERYSSETFVEFLRLGGAKVGANVKILDPRTQTFDYGSRMLIEIGNNVLFTSGCTVLAHDFSYSVSKYAYGKVPQIKMKTRIGNNVFIGMHSIILMGADIGDNVIIGAGSVVHGKVENNSVYAGNPAKKINSLENYTKKNESRQIESALLWANCFVEAFGRIPDISEMGFYRWMFFDKTKENMERYYYNDPFNDVYEKLPKLYDSVEALLSSNNSLDRDLKM